MEALPTVSVVFVVAGLLVPLVATAQDGGTVSGTVTDGVSGEPLPGVNVLVEGTEQGTATDANGEYTIAGVAAGTYTVRASFIGYGEETEEGVEVQAGETTVVDIAMEEATQSLDEVVVVGYGTQQRGELTGSVSSVDVEEAVAAGQSSFEQSLQGRVSGVRVTQTGGGKPGGGINVNIRGVGSINSESPLYVIDGVPVQDSPTGQTGTGILNTLNPNDIESIDILKDASSTAIYGSRASGGVVIITTKSGQSGETQVSFESSLGTQSQPRQYDVLNADQYEAYLREVHASPYSSGLPESFANGERPQNDVDWQDELFQSGTIQNYNLGVAGGGENSTYSLGLGYFDEVGTVAGTGFQRYTLRAKSQFSASDHVSFSGSVISSRSDIEQNDTGGGRRVIEHAVKQAPTVPVYDDSFVGGYGWPVTADGQDADNPIALGNLIDNDIQRYSVIGSADMEISFLNSFTYKLQAGVDFRYDNTTVYNDFYETTRRLAARSSLSEASTRTFNPLLEQTLTYDQAFGDHDVTALAGFSVQSFNYNVVNASGAELPRNVESLGASSTQQQIDSQIQESSLRSFFGRLVYNYDDRYLITGNIRRDESSKLYNSSDPVGVFPSVSVGWRVSEERFMEDVGFVSNLKLRAGWGQIGNQSVLSNYPTSVALNTNYFYVFGDRVTQGIGQQQQANNDLTWETSIQTDVGFQLDLFDDNVHFDFDYYNRRTEDLLWPAQVAPSLGLNPPFINAGTVENSGIELAASYQGNVGDLGFNLSGNLTTINNEVVSLGANNQVEIIEGDATDDIQGVSITRVGEPIGQFYGYETDGLFQNWDEVYEHATQSQDPDLGRDDDTAAQYTAPGDIRFVDQDGNGEIGVEDKVVIGNPIPDFTYGFTTGLTFRNVDFNIFLQGTQGNDIFDASQKWLRDFRQNFNQGTAVLDAWSEDNPDTDVNRVSALDPNSNMAQSNDRFVEDGSYLRVKSVTLGYSFDSSGLTDRIGINRLRVYATGQNLLTFTGYSGLEPEIGSVSSGTARDAGIDRFVYPQPRQLMVGVQMQF